MLKSKLSMAALMAATIGGFAAVVDGSSVKALATGTQRRRTRAQDAQALQAAEAKRARRAARNLRNSR